jgi:hypothetical protein
MTIEQNIIKCRKLGIVFAAWESNSIQLWKLIVLKFNINLHCIDNIKYITRSDREKKKTTVTFYS